MKPQDILVMDGVHDLDLRAGDRTPKGGKDWARKGTPAGGTHLCRSSLDKEVRRIQRLHHHTRWAHLAQDVRLAPPLRALDGHILHCALAPAGRRKERALTTLERKEEVMLVVKCWRAKGPQRLHRRLTGPCRRWSACPARWRHKYCNQGGGVADVQVMTQGAS
jgi:hypothetical protein